jgi:uncharacterized protein (DUF608 family)
MGNKHEYNTAYTGENLDQIAFPIGGIGAGMFCLEGVGAISNLSFGNKPSLNLCPNIFAALHVRAKGDLGDVTRVLEGPVPKHKIFIGTGGGNKGHGFGLTGKNYGLARFADCTFEGRFPFAHIDLKDADVPFDARLTGFSPFEPGDADNASLPFGSLEYTFTNATDQTREAVFYFQSENFMRDWNNQNKAETGPINNGFYISKQGTEKEPWSGCRFDVFALERADVNTAWYRGGWWDSFTMVLNDMLGGESVNKTVDDPKEGRGATLSIPFTLEPGGQKTIRLVLTWFASESDQRYRTDCQAYKPWYSGRFADIEALKSYIIQNIDGLREASKRFSDTFFASSLPPEIIEAVSANLSILKSPTVLRQTDGRLWCWEGTGDDGGCCHGSCTHVWNYQQAVCSLFPSLERSLRQTEFNESQNEEGHQQFRSALPIAEQTHDFHAASDGQLGGIVKVYRDWRISGDTEWLRGLWPRVKKSLRYCSGIWDPKGQGVLTEMHHNTYDIEFYGADIMCSGFYLAALRAGGEMARATGDTAEAEWCDALYAKGKEYAENRLYNGEYFVQETDLSGLEKPPKPGNNITPEEAENFAAEGPKYQYKTGCISDGVIGPWLAKLAGLGDILDEDKVKSHLLSIFKYNYKADLSKHSNPQRPGYAVGSEGGLLLCSWPRGGKPSIPFVYSDEVWTGIEYEVASFLIMEGFTDEGLTIVRALRDRYDGTVRNPFNEYECGNWYARAMASYALLGAYTGTRYDKVTETMYLNPAVSGDFTAFFAGEDGYGLVGIKNGEPFLNTAKGTLTVKNWG